MGFWGRLQRSLGWVEKAEGKYALLERVQQARKVIKPLWPVIVAWLSGAVTTIASFWRTMTLPWFDPWVWTVGGSTVFFVSTGLLLSIPYRRLNELQSKLNGATVLGGDDNGYLSVVPLLDKTPERTRLDSSASSVITVVGREQLEVKYPLSDQFVSTQEIYAAWLTGRNVLRAHTPTSRYADKFKKLILPNPLSDSVKALKGVYSFDVAREIDESLKYASERNIPTRQYPGFWGIELTIGDPTSDNGWAHCAPHVPGLAEDQRFFYRIERKKSPGMFDALVRLSIPCGKRRASSR